MTWQARARRLATLAWRVVATVAVCAAVALLPSEAWADYAYCPSPGSSSATSPAPSPSASPSTSALPSDSPSPSPAPSASTSPTDSPAPSPTDTTGPTPSAAPSPSDSAAATPQPCTVLVALDPGQYQPLLWLLGTLTMILLGWFVATYGRRLRKLGG